jgi:hypothetical protein
LGGRVKPETGRTSYAPISRFGQIEYNMRHLHITGGSVRFRQLISLGLLLAVLSACSPKSTPQPANQDVPMGFTAEGWPYRGNPDATVTLWEFSDFQ